MAVKDGNRRIRGTVRKLGLEGGLWSIVADDGTTFELLDAPNGMLRDGLRVEVEATRRAADVTIGMVGEAITVRSFREI